MAVLINADPIAHHGDLRVTQERYFGPYEWRLVADVPYETAYPLRGELVDLRMEVLNGTVYTGQALVVELAKDVDGQRATFIGSGPLARDQP